MNRYPQKLGAYFLSLGGSVIGVMGFRGASRLGLVWVVADIVMSTVDLKSIPSFTILHAARP